MVIEKIGRESKVQDVGEFKNRDSLKAFGEVKAVVRRSVGSIVEKVRVERYDKECEVRETVKKLV